jgi:hypothetical protein
MAFISSVDEFRYGNLLEYLKNYLAKGAEHYVDSVTKAYNLIVNCKNQQTMVGRLVNDY